MTARGPRPFILTSGKVVMALVTTSEREAADKFFQHILEHEHYHLWHLGTFLKIECETGPPLYVKGKDELRRRGYRRISRTRFQRMAPPKGEMVVMRAYTVSTGNIRRKAIAPSEIEAVAKVCQEISLESVTRKKEYRLGRTIEIKNEGGPTMWLLTETGEQIDPQATGAQEDMSETYVCTCPRHRGATVGHGIQDIPLSKCLQRQYPWLGVEESRNCGLGGIR